MSDLLDKVRDIQVRLESVQRAHVRAEHDRETASAAVAQARASLIQEFGVSTSEEAKLKLAQLEQEVQSSIDALDSKLNQIGG